MAVTIRLTRHGRKKLPFYRIVVADKESPRDGRFIEVLGTMNPLTNPATVTLKEDRVRHWVAQGALTSDTVSSIIEGQIPGFLSELQEKRVAKVRSRRAARKASAKKAGAKRTKSEAKLKRIAKATNKTPVPAKKEAPAAAAE